MLLYIMENLYRCGFITRRFTAHEIIPRLLVVSCQVADTGQIAIRRCDQPNGESSGGFVSQTRALQLTRSANTGA